MVFIYEVAEPGGWRQVSRLEYELFSGKKRARMPDATPLIREV